MRRPAKRSARRSAKRGAWLLLGLALGLQPALAEYSAPAVVKAVNRAELSSELAGRVIELPFRMGAAFRKGDVLVALDCRLYEAQARKVAAELEAASVKLRSASELREYKAIGELEIALAQSEHAQSEAELAMARLNTQRCEIRAPWNGRVVELMVRRFENVTQQQPLISIVDDTRLEAEVVVPATWLAWLKPGQPAQLSIEGLGLAAGAKVSAIAPAVDAVSQTVLLRAAIDPGANLVPGITGTALFQPNATKDQ